MHELWRWNRDHQSTAFVSRISASIEVLFLGYNKTRNGVRRLTHPQCRGHLRGILPNSVRASHPGRPHLARPGPRRLPAMRTVLLVFQQNLICPIQTLYLPWPLTDTDTVMWSLTTFLHSCNVKSGPDPEHSRGALFGRHDLHPSRAGFGLTRSWAAVH